ncbi:MAG TPA: SGNH/GDSL hydrolase family protein [Phycicoccus sp.]
MRRFLGILGVTALLVVVPAAAGTAAPSPVGTANATGYYVALGDSLAAGYQPGQGDDRAGGYVGDVLDAVQAAHPKTRLVNLACSGETAVTLVAGGRCAYDAGSQYAAASRFLHAHGRFTRLVTLQVGANDVLRCVSGGTSIDLACFQAALAGIRANVGTVLAMVRAEAPDAEVVVVNYYDPLLVTWFTDQGLAAQTVQLLALLNGTLAAEAAGTGADVADVATAFHSTDWSPTTLPGVPGTVPTNVAYICTYTWMCSRGDIHANDAGYLIIGQAVVARLG